MNKKRIVSLIVFIIIFSAMSWAFSRSFEQEITSIGPFKWENRILILFTDPESVDDLTKRLREEALLVEDRDMLWFVVTQSDYQMETNFEGAVSQTLGQVLAERYQQRPEDVVEVVLIGKDGGVKYRADELNTDEIYFEVIDVMPMRRAEMREDG